MGRQARRQSPGRGRDAWGPPDTDGPLRPRPHPRAHDSPARSPGVGELPLRQVHPSERERERAGVRQYEREPGRERELGESVSPRVGKGRSPPGVHAAPSSRWGPGMAVHQREQQQNQQQVQQGGQPAAGRPLLSPPGAAARTTTSDDGQIPEEGMAVDMELDHPNDYHNHYDNHANHQPPLPPGEPPPLPGEPYPAPPPHSHHHHHHHHHAPYYGYMDAQYAHAAAAAPPGGGWQDEAAAAVAAPPPDDAPPLPQQPSSERTPEQPKSPPWEAVEWSAEQDRVYAEALAADVRRLAALYFGGLDGDGGGGEWERAPLLTLLERINTESAQVGGETETSDDVACIVYCVAV